MILGLAMVLLPGAALAGENAQVPGAAFGQRAETAFYQTIATDSPPKKAHADDEVELEWQLEAARARLEEAAREVAELSTQLETPLMRQFSMFDGGFGRSIIGVQLDPTDGKEGGARVLEVSPGGPAAEAGIRAGDVIVSVNGTTVTGADGSRQVLKIIRDVKPDSKVNVRVLRDGKTQDFTVTARPRPRVMALETFPHMPLAAIAPAAPLAPMPAIPPLEPRFMIQGPVSNMELANLTPQLGRYFGTDKGVLVVRAPPDGALKLEDGDVILAIDGREPRSGSHATRILGSYQPGEKLTLRIVRQRKTMNVETAVPEGFTGPHRDNSIRGRREGASVPGKVVIKQREDETV
jgi:S1-C subfamily serine protease